MTPPQAQACGGVVCVDRRGGACPVNCFYLTKINMKKIIILAVSAALVTPAAIAAVDIYGFLSNGVEVSRVDDGRGNDLNRVRLVDVNSRIGFQGSDKLDNGLAVLWRSEHRIRGGSAYANGALGLDQQGFGARDTYVGLEGDFGRIRAGTRFSDLVDSSTDDFVGGLGDLGGLANGINKITRRIFDSRPTNIIDYLSPSFDGFRFKTQYDFGSHQEAANAYGYGVSAWYKAQRYEAGVAFKRNENVTGGAVNTSVVSAANVIDGASSQTLVVGGAYRPVEGLTLGGAWQRNWIRGYMAGTTSGPANGPLQYQDGWSLAAKYRTGRLTYEVAGGQVLDSQGPSPASESGAWSVNGGVAYALSKKTQVAATAVYVRNDVNSPLGGIVVPDNGMGSMPAGGSLGGGSRIAAGMLSVLTVF